MDFNLLINATRDTTENYFKQKWILVKNEIEFQKIVWSENHWVSNLSVTTTTKFLDIQRGRCYSRWRYLSNVRLCWLIDKESASFNSSLYWKLTSNCKYVPLWRVFVKMLFFLCLIWDGISYLTLFFFINLTNYHPIIPIMKCMTIFFCVIFA
jgi:hypothetical protein